jgi:hypothetical protein
LASTEPRVDKFVYGTAGERIVEWAN